MPRPAPAFSAALAFLLLLPAAIPLAAQEPAPLRRGAWAAFTRETPILSGRGETLRTAAEGEVVRIREIRDGIAEVTSSIPELGGGFAELSALRPASPADNDTWTAAWTARKQQQAAAAAPLQPAPPPELLPSLEQAEPPPAPLTPNPPPESGPALPGPLLGWLNLGRDTRVRSVLRLDDGAILLSGALKPPLRLPGARSWSGPAPAAASPSDSAAPTLAWLLRLSPDLQSAADFLVFQPGEAGGIGLLRRNPAGPGFWAEIHQPGEPLAGPAAAAPRALVHFSSDLRSVIRAVPLHVVPTDFVVDQAGRPVVLHSPGGRKGGAFLVRFFSSGPFERPWPGAPGGPAARLPLDFSSAPLAEGPFAIWARQAETLPDFPTPLGPWGAAPNAGQPVPWTNVPSGANPIRGASLVPEALLLDHNGNIHIAGTIPFHMGHPDFDPFLLTLSPSGRLLFNNCFLNGLLSEPDQKTQALALDPSSGDILVSYWQHGNNVRTLLLDPSGWLNRFTGTSGNIKISWIGRVEAATGRLKHSTYLYARKPDPKNPGWPDLNSVQIAAMDADSSGRVLAAGAATVSLPVTSNAFLPAVPEGGGYPYLTVIEPDLSAPHYSTYLAAANGAVTGLVLRSRNLAVVVGTCKTSGALLSGASATPPPWLSTEPPDDAEEAVFAGLIPIPEEPAPWSF